VNRGGLGMERRIGTEHVGQHAGDIRGGDFGLL
jgi:hypothetical protein